MEMSSVGIHGPVLRDICLHTWQLTQVQTMNSGLCIALETPPFNVAPTFFQS